MKLKELAEAIKRIADAYPDQDVNRIGVEEAVEGQECIHVWYSFRGPDLPFDK